MIKWKLLRKLIPSKVQIKKDVFYEVFWVETIEGGRLLGECRYDIRQIFVSTKQSDKELCLTFFHELLHAFSHEYELELKETQILKFESTLHYFIKIIKQFKKD